MITKINGEETSILIQFTEFSQRTRNVVSIDATYQTIFLSSTSSIHLNYDTNHLERMRTLNKDTCNIADSYIPS